MRHVEMIRVKFFTSLLICCRNEGRCSGQCVLRSARTSVMGLMASFMVCGSWAQTPASAEGLIKVDFTDIAQKRVIDLPDPDQKDKQINPVEELPTAASIDRLVQMALTINPQLQQAKAQLENLQAQRKVARADLLPSFSLRVAGGPEQSEAGTSNNTGSAGIGSPYDRHSYSVTTVRLSQPLYSRLLRNEYGAALESEEAARLRYRSALEATVLSTVRACVDVISTRLILEFSDEQLSELQAILGYLENRTAAGASSLADLERARTRAFNAQQTRLEQQTAYRNAVYELERLTGKKHPVIEPPGLERFVSVHKDKSVLLDMAYRANADLGALQRDVHAQQLRVKAEFGRYLPAVGVSLEHDSNKNVQGTSPRRFDSRALLVLTWNFSLGGKEWYLAEMASAQLRQREARLHEEKQRLAQAVDAEHALVESSMLRISAARLEQQSAARVVTAVSEQLRSGRLGSLLEALDASDRHFGARQRLTLALGQTIKAQAQLLQSTGQLGDEKFFSDSTAHRPASVEVDRLSPQRP